MHYDPGMADARDHLHALLRATPNAFTTVSLTARQAFGPRRLISDGSQTAGTIPAERRKWRVWWRKPDRLREESSSDLLASDHQLRIVCADQWFFLAQDELHQGSYERSQLQLAKPSLIGLLHPSWLLAADLAILGRASWAGRQAWDVRTSCDKLLESLYPGGSDTLELLLDVESGVLLRALARRSGAVTALTEITSLTFDEPLPETCFRLVPPPGTRVAEPLPLPLPVDAALPTMDAYAPGKPSFPLLLPSVLPRGARLRWTPTESLPNLIPHVVLHLEMPGATHTVSIVEYPCGEVPTGEVDSRPAVHNRHTFWLTTRSIAPGIQASRVRFERYGTDVRLTGTLPESALLDLASCFTPPSSLN